MCDNDNEISENLQTTKRLELIEKWETEGAEGQVGSEWHQWRCHWFVLILLLMLHPSVLEPNFDLSLCQHQRMCHLDPAFPGQIFVGVKLFLQFQNLIPRIGGSLSLLTPGTSCCGMNTCHPWIDCSTGTLVQIIIVPTHSLLIVVLIIVVVLSQRFPVVMGTCDGWVVAEGLIAQNRVLWSSQSLTRRKI